MDNQVKYTVSAQDLLSGALAKMNSNANALETTMGSLQGTINKVGSIVGIAFGVQQIGNFVNKVLDAGTTVENATTGLTTLLGDSSEAVRVVQNAMEDATKTPFAFEGLLSANKALIGAGVEADRARADVLNLANAIAATGGGDNELQRMVVNMQQISNTGKATAMDIKQFAFAGVNIYKVLAEATGQPIAKVKDMEISYDMLTFALQKAHDKGGIYYNGLENMASNTSVQMSNVGDAVFQMMNDIFTENKPLIDSVIQSMLDFLQTLRDAAGWLKENKAGVLAFAGAIGTITTAIMLYNTYQKIMAWWAAFTATSILYETFALGAMTAGMAGASAGGMILAGVMALINAVNPFMWIVLAIAAVVGAVIYCWNKFAAFRGFLYAFWSVLKTFAGIIGEAFMALGKIIHGVFMLDLDAIKQGYNQMVELTTTSAAKIASAAKNGYKEGLDSFAKDNLKTTPGKEKSKRPGGIAPLDMTLGAGGKDKSKSVSGPKVITINVTIGNLINDFQIKTTNMVESSQAVHDKIVQALTGAINDSQIIAGDG